MPARGGEFGILIGNRDEKDSNATFDEGAIFVVELVEPVTSAQCLEDVHASFSLGGLPGIFAEGDIEFFP